MLLPFYDRQVVKLHSFSSFPSSSISSSSPPSPVPLSHHSCFDQQVVKLQDTASLYSFTSESLFPLMQNYARVQVVFARDVDTDYIQILDANVVRFLEMAL